MTLSRRPLLAVLATALAMVIIAGCGDQARSPLPQAPTSSTVPSATDPAFVDSPPPEESDGPDDTPPAGTITVDPSLLAILPASVDGVPISEATDNEASLATEPTLLPTAAALAVGYAIAPTDTANDGQDLAVVSVVRLRPGVFSDTFWSGWRSAYDEAACEPAGGVASHDARRSVRTRSRSRSAPRAPRRTTSTCRTTRSSRSPASVSATSANWSLPGCVARSRG